MLEQWLFRLTNWLGLAGAILVLVLLCAAALGKWKKGIAFRLMLWFSLAGIAIPLVLFLVSMYISAHDLVNAEIRIQSFFLVLWPSSIGLMGLEGTGSTASELSTIAVLVLINAGLYGMIGLFAGSAWQGLMRFRKERK